MERIQLIRNKEGNDKLNHATRRHTWYLRYLHRLVFGTIVSRFSYVSENGERWDVCELYNNLIKYIEPIKDLQAKIRDKFLKILFKHKASGNMRFFYAIKLVSSKRLKIAHEKASDTLKAEFYDPLTTVIYFMWRLWSYETNALGWLYICGWILNYKNRHHPGSVQV